VALESLRWDFFPSCPEVTAKREQKEKPLFTSPTATQTREEELSQYHCMRKNMRQVRESWESPHIYLHWTK